MVKRYFVELWKYKKAQNSKNLVSAITYHKVMLDMSWRRAPENTRSLGWLSLFNQQFVFHRKLVEDKFKQLGMDYGFVPYPKTWVSNLFR